MKHDLIYRKDADGESVVGVRLSNTEHRAWLRRCDYESIVAMFGATAWFLHSNQCGNRYVQLSNPIGNVPVTIARMIGKAARNSQVTYEDGDRLNLRRSNLRVKSRWRNPQ